MAPAVHKALGGVRGGRCGCDGEMEMGRSASRVYCKRYCACIF